MFTNTFEEKSASRQSNNTSTSFNRDRAKHRHLRITMIVIIEAYRAGLLKFKNWLPNIMAGLIVGVVALPLAMAFAIASGVKPEQGLYTAIIAGFIVSVFGGSRVQIAGPTGAFIVILSGITAQYGYDGLQIA